MAKSIFAAPHFQNDDDARIMLESILWPAGPVCPHCGVIGHSYATKRPGVYRCAEKACRKDFTVTMRTVMERSKIALHKWLQAFHLVTSSKKGVSAHQLHRTLNIGYEAAWFMHHRIREAMRTGGLGMMAAPMAAALLKLMRHILENPKSLTFRHAAWQMAAPTSRARKHATLAPSSR
jgi:transposase-like protein